PRVHSEYLAENFAADVLLARLMVGHHALRRRQDGDAEAVGALRNRPHRHINAATGFRNAGDLTDYRLALEILQLDFDFRFAVVVVHLAVVADIAFRLQHVEDAGAEPGSRRRDLVLLKADGVADAGKHIAERIVHGHRKSSLPARLDQARHEAGGAKIAHRDTRHAKFAVIGARTPRDLAAVADTRGRRVARHRRQLQLRLEALLDRQLLVHDDGLQLLALGRVTLHERAAVLVLFDCTGLCHVAFLFLACRYCRKGKLKALSSARASSSVLAVVQTITSIPQI